jgi:hypothetical protein
VCGNNLLYKQAAPITVVGLGYRLYCKTFQTSCFEIDWDKSL